MKQRLPKILSTALVAGLLILAFHATISAFLVRNVPSLSVLALRNLARMGEKALPYVLDFLQASEPRVRRLGVSLLEAVGESGQWADRAPEVLDAVLKQFRSETDPMMKRHMARILASSNTEEAVTALREGLDDPAIQTACAGALESMAQSSSSPSVKEAAGKAAELIRSEEATRARSAAVRAVGAAAGVATEGTRFLGSVADTLISTESP